MKNEMLTDVAEEFGPYLRDDYVALESGEQTGQQGSAGGSEVTTGNPDNLNEPDDSTATTLSPLEQDLLLLTLG